jgi:uncharacterized protein YndB with AHSA1/START domain
VNLQREITIARPPAEVFAFVSDPGNLPTWQRSVLEVRDADAQTAVGGRFQEVRHFVGKRFETTVEIVELEQERVFSVRVIDGPLPLTVRHLFEPAGEGTRLVIKVEARPQGLMRLAAAPMAKAAEHDAEVNLAHLKTLLEDRVSAADSD